MLFILDEIQTGIGRTGSLFAYEQYDVEPDIMTLAKGLGSGFPIGAILAKDKASVFAAGEHGSTFGGNPIACAAGYAVLKYIIDNNIAENVRQTGDYLSAGLDRLKQKYAFIKEIRGRGLLLALEFDGDIARELTLSCLQNGLLINILKTNAIRLIPPLNIGRSEADEALGILDKALGNIKQV